MAFRNVHCVRGVVCSRQGLRLHCVLLGEGAVLRCKDLVLLLLQR